MGWEGGAPDWVPLQSDTTSAGRRKTALPTPLQSNRMGGGRRPFDLIQWSLHRSVIFILDHIYKSNSELDHYTSSINLPDLRFTITIPNVVAECLQLLLYEYIQRSQVQIPARRTVTFTTDFRDYTNYCIVIQIQPHATQ